MVGLVLVSHSRKLAESVRELALQMTQPDFPIAVAAGVGENFDDLGTDAVHIADVVQKLSCPEGVLVLMDLGSAVLSAQTALELIDVAHVENIRLCAAPLVEGAIAAAVRAQGGGSLDEVAHEAELALAAKQQQLQEESLPGSPSAIDQPAAALPGETAELTLTVANPHGLHARPAATLVRAITPFSSSVEVFSLTSGRGPASARSLTGLCLLQIQQGDRIKFVCGGSDCQSAVQAIRELATAGFGEAVDARTALTPPTSPPSSGAQSLPASDGIAIGPLVLLDAVESPEDEGQVEDPATELAKLTSAMKTVSDELQEGGLAKAGVEAGSGAILEAQALILADPVVLSELRSLVEDHRLSGSQAWKKVTSDLAARYEAMGDPYLRERASDVRDIARRVFRKMKGGESHLPIRFADPAIVFTDELLPSDAAACEPTTVLGVVTARGSATSHSAIILRTLGIPMVVGASKLGEETAGKIVAIDGATGEIWIEPDPATIAKLEKSRQAQLQRREQAKADCSRPSITLDGSRIEILANVGKVQDAVNAARNGAEGVGLLRTEFLFASRQQAPSEDEQVSALREIYAAISGPIIVRTLDVGADKPLPFLRQPEEHNPYLGMRGIRLSLKFPQLFLTHLRAILRSGTGHDIWLMFPMVSLVHEVSDALRLLDQAHYELRDEDVPHIWPIKRGVMIEVPSAALISERLAGDLDFFSIGTNDLTQYTMAAERGSADMAPLQDSLHPAVLGLMKAVVDGARKRMRHVSVCGDAASDPLAAAIFTGLGIRSLSVRPNQVAELKALFRSLRLDGLLGIAAQSLNCPDAATVRKLVGDYLDSVSATLGNSPMAQKTGIEV